MKNRKSVNKRGRLQAHINTMGVWCVLVSLVVLPLVTSCGPAIRKPTRLSRLGDQPTQNYPSTQYKIQTGDELDIKFFTNPELNEHVTVKPDGMITLQLVPDIVALDKTSTELMNDLEKYYEKELANPRLAVIVRTFNSQKAYVAGEVDDPRLVDLTGKTTVLQAIAEAGGFLKTARMDEVVLIRRQDDDRPLAIPINLASVIDGTNTGEDIILMPYDVVFVPRSPIANVNLWVEQYVREVIPFRAGFGFTYRLDSNED